MGGFRSVGMGISEFHVAQHEFFAAVSGSRGIPHHGRFNVSVPGSQLLRGCRMADRWSARPVDQPPPTWRLNSLHRVLGAEACLRFSTAEGVALYRARTFFCPIQINPKSWEL